MKTKIFALIAAITCVIMNANAQQNKPKWSLDFGGGITTKYDNRHLGSVGHNLQIGGVAMIMPQLGFRASVYGGFAKNPSWTQDWKFPGKHHYQAAISLDVLWDVIKTFNNMYRNYAIQPYVRISDEIGFKNKAVAMSIGYGAGIRQTIGFNKKVGLLIDMNAILTTERAWTGNPGYMVFPKILFGINYTL